MTRKKKVRANHFSPNDREFDAQQKRLSEGTGKRLKKMAVLNRQLDIFGGTALKPAKELYFTEISEVTVDKGSSS